MTLYRSLWDRFWKGFVFGLLLLVLVLDRRVLCFRRRCQDHWRDWVVDFEYAYEGLLHVCGVR